MFLTAGGGAAQVLPPGATVDSTPRPEAAPARTLLDVPVDRTQYRLGADDVLSIAVYGELNLQFSPKVSPEGTVVVPGLGFVQVGGLTVEAAEQRIRQLVLRNYRNVNVHVSLSSVRHFKVFLVGDVPRAGVHAATAVTRLSEVVPLSDVYGVVRRQVLIRRSRGDSTVVDLARFTHLGSLESNPFLTEGDALVVTPVQRTVRVVGRVNYPGTYEYVNGETLADFLNLVNGGAAWRGDAADTIRLSRVSENGQETLLLAVSDVRGELGRTLRLQPFDALYVPEKSHYMEQHLAVVTGEVARPGAYPIEPGRTTARDLVDMAGGFTELASLVNATLRRPPPERGTVPAELQRIPPELMSATERRIAQIRAQGDETNVVIDFRQMFAAGQAGYDQPLLSGDALHVPRRRDEITVLGAVKEPGIVSYQPGLGPGQYIRRVGGYSARADKGNVVVLKGKLGTRLQAEDVKQLEPGDMVVAPFKEPRSFMDTLRDVSAVLTPLATIVLTVIAVRDATR